MASNAVIGALRVILGADNSALDKSLAESQSAIARFGGDVAKAGALLAAAMTAAYAAVSLGIANTIQQMDGLAKQSQKIGIPVEQLSALKLAADVSVVSMETLGTGMGKLSKTMVEAAAKPTSEAALAFKALGVSVVDANGNLRPVIDVATSIAGKFEGLKDGAGKTAVSMALLGKGGAELIPLFNMGADGITKMMQSAQQFGIVIDTQTAAAATKFQTTLIMLGAAKDGLIVKLTAYLLPALQALAQRMLDAASNADKQAAKLSFLKTSFDIFGRAVLLVADNFLVLLKLGAVFIGAQIGAAVISMALAFARLALAVYTTGVAMTLFNAIKMVSLRGILLIAGVIALASGNLDTLKEKLTALADGFMNMLPEGAGGGIMDMMKNLGVNIRALEGDLKGMGTATDNAGKKQSDFNFKLLAGKTAFDQYLDSQNKSQAAQVAELATVGLAAGAKDRLKVILQGLAVAQANGIVLTDAQRMALSITAYNADQLGLKLTGIQLVQQNQAPGVLYQQEMANTNTAMMAVGATAEQLARAGEAVGQKFGMTASQIGSSVADTAGSLSNLTGTFAKENKSMGIASKAFGIAQAIINTQIAITKALATLPPPASYFAVAAAVAQGAASIATISAQQFKTGGAIRVPGGMGGGDSVRAMVDLQPGEQLDVWRPGEAGGDPRRGGGTGGSREIVVRGLRLTDIVTGKALIEALNTAIGDGGRVRLAQA